MAMSPTDKPLIAVDLDEVLGWFVRALNKFHNARFGTSYREADYFSYHFSDVWGCTDAVAVERVGEFLGSEEFASITAVAAANETLSSLAPRFRFAVVTSRQAAVEGATRSWLERQFPGIFESVHFGNHYASDGTPARSKAEICKEIGAVALIDDSRHHALECARAGLKCVILFGDYSWNRPSMGSAPESAGAGAAAAAADNTLLAAMPNVFPCPDWRLVKPVLQRITPSGELADVPSLWVRGGAEEAAAMRTRAETTLMRQPALDVTAVGVSITPLLTLVAGLKHEGLVEEVKTSSGLDAGYNASTGRMPRLTVKVRRTPKLLEDAAARERALAVEADALRDASKQRAEAAFAKAAAAAAASPAAAAAQA